MQFRSSFRVCLPAVAAFLCAACSKPATTRLPQPRGPDYVEIVVVNKGPGGVNDLDVHLAGQDIELEGVGPGVFVACRFSPRPDQIGQTTTVVLEYEDDDGGPIRLESKAFKIPPVGRVRLDIGGNKLVAEEVSDKPSRLTNH